jgi:DNA-binding transcriptional LysR family regulator
VIRLVEGSCDLLIAYHHPSQPFQLDAERYEMVSLGEELVAPYSRADAQGEPLFRLPGTSARPLPYLGYAPGAYMGQVVESMLKQTPTPMHLDRVYETDMAEGLKAMALEGHGIAFLPQSAIRKELRSRKLVSAVPPGLPPLQTTMDIRAYREKPVGKEAQRNAHKSVKSAPQGLWAYLTAQRDAAR